MIFHLIKLQLKLFVSNKKPYKKKILASSTRLYQIKTEIFYFLNLQKYDFSHATNRQRDRQTRQLVS